jgi:hypothetical protein
MSKSVKTQSKASRTRTTTSIFQRLSENGGRFFGLYLNSGERINAQYRSQTEKYLMVYDRNRARNRRILKSCVSTVNI